jgi:3(or 17)beta-hydroxysteroid dehydrogenase
MTSRQLVWQVEARRSVSRFASNHSGFLDVATEIRMSRLAGKTVLVTGAAGQIGSAIVAAVRREGGIAIATDLAGKAGIDHALDVTSEQSWADVIAAVKAAGHNLQGLVNSAGVTAVGHLDTTDFATWRRTLAVNLDGTFLGCKYALPLLRSHGGSIVNLASVFGMVGGANTLAYSASKGGVRQLTKSVALHGATLKPQVRCNAICPAYVEGEMTDSVIGATPRPDFVRQFLAREIPAGRFGRGDEIAGLCIYLLADESAFVTGADIAIDGGFTAR